MAAREAAGGYRASGDLVLTDVYAACWVPLVRLAHLLLRDQARAEAVVQAAVAAAYPRLRGVRDTGRAHAYLTRAVVRGCRSAGRRRVLRQAPATGVLDAVLALPLRQREVVVLRYYLDLADQPVADALGISRVSVRTHGERALVALQPALGEDAATPRREARLREALHREGDATRPADRLPEIRGAAHSDVRRRRTRALAALTALATLAALVVALAAWTGLRGEDPVRPTPLPAPLPDPPPVDLVLPVYFVAPPAAPGGRYGLVRRYVPTRLPAAAAATALADTALRAAVAPAGPDPVGLVPTWPTGTSARIVAHPGVEIDVEVSQGGGSGLPEPVQALAVQALVWTVTEVLGEPQAPVRVGVATGGSVFETVGPNVFKRPGPGLAYHELVAVWVDSPYPGQGLSAASPVVVTGQACTPGGAVAWEVRRGDTVLRTGTTPTASTCPLPGVWAVYLGTLPAGAYQFLAAEKSAHDGAPLAEDVRVFSVG